MIETKEPPTHLIRKISADNPTWCDINFDRSKAGYITMMLRETTCDACIEAAERALRSIEP